MAIYMKTPAGKKVDIEKLRFGCDCLMCGKSTEIPDFWDLVTDPDIDFDLSTGVLCDECTAKARNN